MNALCAQQFRSAGAAAALSNMRTSHVVLLVLLVTAAPLAADIRYDRTFRPVRDPLTTGEPPFAGTVWVNSNIINSSDPSAGRTVTYTGRGERQYWDCPASEWIDINAYLFDVNYDSRPAPTEFQVHPDSGDLDSVREFVEEFALALGRMPRALMANVKEVELINGVDCGGGNRGGSIHWGRDPNPWVERNGWLDEVLFHEAVHTTLDADHLESTGWRAAQEADGNSISDYARDFPDREDLAETALMWFAVRYHPERLTAKQRNAVLDAIPNRLAYLDEQMLDMSPYIVRTWSLADDVKDLVDEALEDLEGDSEGREATENVPALPAAGLLLLAILLGLLGRRRLRVR